jgi:hypothetical protein
VATRQIPWLRIFAEGVAIVVSILLAFGIQAWWEERQEREEERRILQALSEDFSETREDLLSNTAGTVESSEQAKELLRIMSEGSANEQAEEVIALLANSFTTWTYEPRLSTYEEIIGSGDLGLVRSDTLRVQMALAVAFVETLLRHRETGASRWYAIEEPYLIGIGAREHLARYRDPGLPAFGGAIDVEAILTPELANILYGRMDLVGDLVYMTDNATRSIDQVLALIEAELQQ